MSVGLPARAPTAPGASAQVTGMAQGQDFACWSEGKLTIPVAPAKLFRTERALRETTSAPKANVAEILATTARIHRRGAANERAAGLKPRPAIHFITGNISFSK